MHLHLLHWDCWRKCPSDCSHTCAREKIFKHACAVRGVSCGDTVQELYLVSGLAWSTFTTPFLALFNPASLRAFYVNHGLAPAFENVHDHKPLIFIRIHVSMHQEGRDMEEVASPHYDRIGISRAVFKPHATSHHKAVQVTCSMVMPTRHFFRLEHASVRRQCIDAWIRTPSP